MSGGPGCPLPISEYPHVLLAHGGGGRLTQTLIERVFLEAFRNPALETLHDGALVETNGGRLAFSTDSFVVDPLSFPGGDIGSLAVHGTVNDLAMCGARPLALSAGFIIEEGLSMELLWQFVTSMRDAALRAEVPIVTGDTKVVDRGKGDGLFINTAGIGTVLRDVAVSPRGARPGDDVVINGSIAEHGITIMSVREGLEFETSLVSDSAALNHLVGAVLERMPDAVHTLRDPTRGGLASALNEIAAQSNVGIAIDEIQIPLREEVRGACEILGLDPLYVANEGKCLLFVAPERTDDALETLRRNELGRNATVIGKVVDEHPGRVVLRSRVGGRRIVDMLSGEQLPRIC
jgi:hydrogenase expression/formation protein HypE